MIKRYGQFIKENKQVNENIEEFDEIPSNEDPEFDENEISEDPEFEDGIDEIGADDSEEEGGSYIGREMIQNLADALDTQIDADGSINYNGKKINFYSETEMFHIGNQKFETVDEVVDFLERESGMAADEESDDMKNDEIIRQRELEDDKALLSGEGQEESQEEEEFESKSYKHTRKFESFRKK